MHWWAQKMQLYVEVRTPANDKQTCMTWVTSNLSSSTVVLFFPVVGVGYQWKIGQETKIKFWNGLIIAYSL